jgi:hypothetical protein
MLYFVPSFTRSLKRGIQKLFQKYPRKGAETDSRAKLGKETVVGVHRRIEGQNKFHILVRWLTQGVLRILRLCSGILALSSS